MKSIKIVLLCFICITLLTGCLKENFEMEIRSDKSMRVSLLSAVSDEVINMVGEDNDESLDMTNNEEIEKYKKLGFEVEEYKQDGFTGFKVTRNIKNIDEISSTELVTDNISNIFEDNAQKQYYFLVKRGFFKNKYKAVFKIENDDYESMMDNYEDVDLDIDMDEFKKSLETKFVLYLPNKAISNNASFVSENNKVLTWDLLNNNTNNIEFEFELINRGSTYSVIAVVSLVLLIILIEFISGMKKKPLPSPVHIEKTKLESDDIGEVDVLGGNIDNKIRENTSI